MEEAPGDPKEPIALYSPNFREDLFSETLRYKVRVLEIVPVRQARQRAAYRL